MAAAAAIGGDELARMRGKGEIQGRRESERECERSGGSAWHRRGPPAASGEAGGGRRVLARGGHTRCPPSRRKTTGKGDRWAGLLLGCTASGPAQELGRR